MGTSDIIGIIQIVIAIIAFYVAYLGYKKIIKQISISEEQRIFDLRLALLDRFYEQRLRMEQVSKKHQSIVSHCKNALKKSKCNKNNEIYKKILDLMVAADKNLENLLNASEGLISGLADESLSIKELDSLFIINIEVEMKLIQFSRHASEAESSVLSNQI